jgi:hypothetical protein
MAGISGTILGMGESQTTLERVPFVNGVVLQLFMQKPSTLLSGPHVRVLVRHERSSGDSSGRVSVCPVPHQLFLQFSFSSLLDATINGMERARFLDVHVEDISPHTMQKLLLLCHKLN